MSATDNRNRPIQMSFLSIGVIHLTSSARYQELIQSDEGLFREHILPIIPIDLVKLLYSDREDVRPAKYAVSHVAALLFVRMTGLTEEKFLQQIPWNLKYQYALGIDQWEDDTPFGPDTFRSLRARIENYNKSHKGEDIWERITHAIDIQLANKMNLFKGYDKQYEYGLRMDSLMISMQAAKRPRLDIIYTTMAIVVFKMVEMKIELPAEFKHFLDDHDYRSWIYYKGTQQEYEAEGFALPENPEEKMTTTKRKDAITEHRVEKLLKEACALHALCLGNELTDTEEFALLDRLIHEQVDFDEDGVPYPKDKSCIAPNSMQTPYEPEATYRYKAGNGYHGYVGFITEIFNKNGDGIIIDRRLEQNQFTDQAYMRDFQEHHDPILDLDDGKKGFISVDAGFISTELNKRTKELLHCDVYCAGVHGVAPNPIFADFVLSDDKQMVTACPTGKKPDSCSRVGGSIKARFATKCCSVCDHEKDCGAVTTGSDGGRGSSYVTVSEAKIAAALCVRMRQGAEGEDVTDFLDKRNAIEGINSVLRRRYEVDNRHTPGIVFARHDFYSAITCYNIIKYFKYLRRKEKESTAGNEKK